MPAGRPPGSKNKPKYVHVKLSDLNKIFSQDTYIQVNPEYLRLLDLTGYATEEESESLEIIRKDVPFTEL